MWSPYFLWCIQRRQSCSETGSLNSVLPSSPMIVDVSMCMSMCMFRIAWKEIRSFSKPNHWNHVHTDCNPADLVTRECHASDLPNSMWIHWPTFLHQDQACEGGLESKSEFFAFCWCWRGQKGEERGHYMSKDNTKTKFWVERFSEFFTWKNLLRTVVDIKIKRRPEPPEPLGNFIYLPSISSVTYWACGATQ